jgi:hypothetical protein
MMRSDENVQRAAARLIQDVSQADPHPWFMGPAGVEQQFAIEDPVIVSINRRQKRGQSPTL